MSENNIPEWYLSLKEKHESYINALDELGRVIRQEGPLKLKS